MRKRSGLSRIYFAVRWLKHRNDEGTPLADLVSNTEFPKGGKWSYSNYFVQVETVLTYGFKPSDFELCDPADDLSVMVAHNDTKARMQTYLEKRSKQKNS